MIIFVFISVITINWIKNWIIYIKFYTKCFLLNSFCILLLFGSILLSIITISLSSENQHKVFESCFYRTLIACLNVCKEWNPNLTPHFSRYCFCCKKVLKQNTWFDSWISHFRLVCVIITCLNIWKYFLDLYFIVTEHRCKILWYSCRLWGQKLHKGLYILLFSYCYESHENLWSTIMREQMWQYSKQH